MTYQDIINDLISGKIYTNLDPTRRSIWPKYCYHFTDLQNALNVFKKGAIYSRKLVRHNKWMKNDDANKKIIKETNPFIFQYARFYFRPQTPMLYQIEGARLNHLYKYSDKNGKPVKCPFPIYFLFDLSEVLNLKSSKFSPISLARHQSLNLKDSPEEFANMPFEAIYSDRLHRMNGFDGYYYTGHEQAEVIVRNSLSLKYLRYIIVRSEADEETLKQELRDLKDQHKLDNQDFIRYSSMIKVDTVGIYFYKFGCYVKKVDFNSNGFNVNFAIPKPKISNHYIHNDYVKKVNPGKEIYGGSLKWNMGYRLEINFIHSSRTIIYPYRNYHKDAYLSKRTCNYCINNYHGEPYLLRIYLSTLKEPIYYAKYIPSNNQPKQRPTSAPGNGINTNFGNNNDTFSDDDLPF